MRTTHGVFRQDQIVRVATSFRHRHGILTPTKKKTSRQQAVPTFSLFQRLKTKIGPPERRTYLCAAAVVDVPKRKAITGNAITVDVDNGANHGVVAAGRAELAIEG